MSPAEAELAFDLNALPFQNYIRIAVVKNPFLRLAQIYDRIAISDPVWRFRERVRRANPDFCSWLENTRSSGTGAGFSAAQRWRKFGVWSMNAWADGRITHFVRAENLTSDLRHVFRQLGVIPCFAAKNDHYKVQYYAEMLRYDSYTSDIIRERYASDLSLYQTSRSQIRLVA